MDPKKDYYKILGLSENASQEEIKKVYRRLAKEYHPDTKSGDKTSEERFKNISEAYSILKDPKKRQEYDLMRKNPFASGQGGFDFRGFSRQGGTRAEYGDFGGSSDFDDILSSFFGFGKKKPRASAGFGFNEDIFSRNRSRPRQKGTDYHASIRIPFELAANGGETFVQTPTGKNVKLRITPGTEDGKKVKLTGYGSTSPDGGPAGDLYITLQVDAHPHFERKGNDIYSYEEVNYAQALLGSEIEVRTIHDQTVKLKIPAGTDSGKTFRLKKLGIEGPTGTGDHYVRIMIRTPKNLSGRIRKQFEEWARAAGMFDQD